MHQQLLASTQKQHFPVSVCVYICGAVCGILIKVASFDFFPTTGIQADKCFAL